MDGDDGLASVADTLAGMEKNRPRKALNVAGAETQGWNNSDIRGLKHNDQVHLEEEKGKGSLHRTTCTQVWYEDFRW